MTSVLSTNSKSDIANIIRNFSGIDFNQIYTPGVVSIADGNLMAHPVVIVTWKIDDPLWKLATTGRDRISETHDWTAGIQSFTTDSYSWEWGMHACTEYDAAIKLRERIIEMTALYGVHLRSIETKLAPRG